MDNIVAIVLAAGKGKRMKSDLPKVLHTLFGRPLIEHLVDTLISMSINRIVVVVGHRADLVQKALAKYGDSVEFVVQEKQLGTGHAVIVTENALSGYSGDILVLAGDVPFLSRNTIERLVALHRQEKAAATVLSAIPPDPKGYGRIVRIPGGNLVDRIVEHKDANPEELKIGEINSGTFCFDARQLFPALREVKADNSQKEYYITDVMAILRHKGLKTAVCLATDPDEALGVNSAEQLAELENRFADKSGNYAPAGGRGRIKS
ncbi:MAG: NTP transferase domain-containing protein [candidate division Zixibacteria bacterium]|nr:NTP transferase domain-containing protein [candidate division Zixibacteria bacterium]